MAGIQAPSIMNVDASCNTVGIRVCTVVGDCGIRLREAEELKGPAIEMAVQRVP